MAVKTEKVRSRSTAVNETPIHACLSLTEQRSSSFTFGVAKSGENQKGGGGDKVNSSFPEFDTAGRAAAGAQDGEGISLLENHSVQRKVVVGPQLRSRRTLATRSRSAVLR